MTAEAVDIYRPIAGARAFFTRNLALGLDSLASTLSGLGRHAEAFAAVEEAFDLLAPGFRRNPGALREPMQEVATHYQKHAEAAGRQPVDEVLEVLEELEEAS